MQNITMLRIGTKIKEMFDCKVDVSDCKEESSFYSRSLAALAVMMECGIDEYAAAACITDGYHDLGIDAIYCDEIQKKLFLVQSKWRNEGSGSITHGETLSFIDGVKKIMNFEFESGNEKIKAKIPEINTAIRSMDFQVQMIFIHTGNQPISNYSVQSINAWLRNVNDDVNDILSFKEIKQSDIFKYLASGQESEISIGDVILYNWGSLDEPYKAYYGHLPAGALAEWYLRYGNRLFARNIRFYKGNTDVNSGMKKVLQEEPENFFYYNNGIKILCKKITRKAAYSGDSKIGAFALEGVSLVNGAQTTGAIGAAFGECPSQVSTARVMVQLIDLSDAPQEYATQVTKLSNTQNRIDSKEFAALDPEQERLRTDLLFSGISYLYKSGAEVEDPEHQISIDEAIVALACLGTDISYTATAKRNVGALTDDINKPPYKALFNATTNGFTLKNSVELLRCVEDYLQEHEADYQARNRLALVHGNRFITHLVMQEGKRIEKFNSVILANEELKLFANKACEVLVPKVIQAMNEKFPDAYPAYIFKNVGRCREMEQAINALSY